MTPLILLHGFTGSPASFRELLAGLARRGVSPPLLCPALLGHGAEAAGDVLSFTEEVDRVAALVRAQRLAGAHLCGYSLGARVALGLLARYPYLFRSATLVSLHPGLSDPRERASRVGSDERWCALLMRSGLRAFLEAWQAQPLFDTQRGLLRASWDAQRRIRESHSAYGLARALRVLGLGQMPNYRGALVAYPGPVRLMAGALDQKFVGLAQALAASSPGILLERLPGVGHNVLLEATSTLADVLTQALAA